VQLTSYYDALSQAAYNVNFSDGALGAETGYFYSPSEGFLFGANSSVNLYNYYSFVFFYDDGSGDFYQGDVYALPSDVPTLLATASQTTDIGHYEFVNMGYGVAMPVNPVEVYLYFDAETQHFYNLAPTYTTGAFGEESAPVYGQEYVVFSPYQSASLVNRYGFVYYYDDGSGDYYFGNAYAPAAQVPALLAAGGPNGHYQFVDMDYGFDASLHNPVEVAAYYDANSQHFYGVYPWDTTGPLGAEESTFFGDWGDALGCGASHSVDAVNRYVFVYFYDDGSHDFYYGAAYAPAADVPLLLAAGSPDGHYQFVDMAYGFAPPANPVDVFAYYDAGSQYFYSAYGATGGLGSESAYFYGYDDFNFTPTSPANVVNRYSFAYFYNSGGDFYLGEVYAPAADVPLLLAAGNPNGAYQFVDMAHGFDPLQHTPLEVAAYYDAATQHFYWVSPTATTGALGSETSEFNGAGGAFTFTPSTPANVVNRYSFVYHYYVGGDYYLGGVYATPGDVPGLLGVTSPDGYYEFVDLAYGYVAPAHPVEVNSYYDANSRHLYAVAQTTGSLGAETGSFFGDGGTSFSFTPNPPAELNLVNQYSFIYTYTLAGNGGDSYVGDVYASAAQGDSLTSVTNPSGYYQFVNMAYGYAAQVNPVQVAYYYDGSTARYYVAYNSTGELSSESAWITDELGNPVNFGPGALALP